MIIIIDSRWKWNRSHISSAVAVEGGEWLGKVNINVILSSLSFKLTEGLVRV